MLHGCITSTCPEQLVLIKILLSCVRDREYIDISIFRLDQIDPN